MPLDRSLPIAEIIGVPGVAFAQGDEYYSFAGRPMRETADGWVPADEPDAAPIAAPKASFVDMPYQALRTQFEMFGGDWNAVCRAHRNDKDRKAAMVAFLEGHE